MDKDRLARLSGELAWVITGQALAFLGALAGVKILTGLMPPSAYGEFAIALSVAGAVNMLIFGPIAQIALRYYSVCQERGVLPEMFGILRVYHTQTVLWAGVLVLPLFFVLQAAMNPPWSFVVTSSVLLGAAMGLQGSLQSVLLAMRDRRKTATFQAADTWCRILLAAAAVALFGDSSVNAVLGYLLGTTLVVAWQLWVLRDRVLRKPVSDVTAATSGLKTEFFSYGAPFVAVGAVTMLGQYLDRWILQITWGPEDVGIYAATYQVAFAAVSLVMAVASQLVIPIGFARAGDPRDSNRLRQGHRIFHLTTFALAVVFAAAAICAWVWAEELMNGLTSPSFARDSENLWILVLAVGLIGLAQFSTNVGYTLNKSAIYIRARVGQIVFLLLIGMVLVPEHGTRGISVALLASAVVFTIWIAYINFTSLPRTQAG